MTKEEAISKYIVPALKNTWNDKINNKVIKALEQESCEDIETIYEAGYSDGKFDGYNSTLIEEGYAESHYGKGLENIRNDK